MTNKPKSRRSAKAKVAQAHSSTSKLRHLKLVHRRHSGKMLAHHHTSYFGLACILAIVGLVVHSTQGVWASPPPISHDVTIDALVAGPPPTDGATITSPVDGAEFTDQSIIEVDGTCAANTTVVVSSNNSVVGSTACGTDDTFSVNVQLDNGVNVLSARNYDVANQPGPDTPDVTVTVKTTTPPPTNQTSSGSSGVSAVTSEPVVVPENTTPYVVGQNPDQSPCDSAKTTTLPDSAVPRVAVTCISRVFKANVQYSIQIGVWGGKSPYAVDIDWGDPSIPHTLMSLTSASFKTVTVVYAKAGTYTIKVNVKDSAGSAAYVQASAIVPGSINPISAVANAISRVPWFSTPVPAYTLAVMITAGFWLGEVFTHFISNSGNSVRRIRPKKIHKKPS